MKRRKEMIKIAVVFLAIIALTPFTLFNHSVPVAADGNVASASGGAHNGTLNLSFGAFDHGEGNITGQATFIDDATKARITIDIECLTISGSQADVGGTVTRSSHPAFSVGTAVHFIVDDQGEGVGVTDYFTLPSNGSCSSRIMGAALPSDRGNIQVRFVAPDKDCGKCPMGTHCAGNGECVGGGGNLHCSADEKECCGSCIPKDVGCPACPSK
jgi:hypothetical protein